MAAAAVDITQVLLGASSSDGAVRTQAEAQLKQFQQQNNASYLLSLATEVANASKPEDARQIAGLILKNSLDAPGLTIKVWLYNSLLQAIPRQGIRSDCSRPSSRPTGWPSMRASRRKYGSSCWPLWPLRCGLL